LEVWRTLEAQNGGAEAQNETVKGLSTNGHRLASLVGGEVSEFRIRIKVKGRTRIHIEVKRKIRIRFIVFRIRNCAESFFCVLRYLVARLVGIAADSLGDGIRIRFIVFRIRNTAKKLFASYGTLLPDSSV
jgi:hypothetical protein